MSKEVKNKNYPIRPKDNGDIYNYDPIKGFTTHNKLYDSEFAFQNKHINEKVEENLDEAVNNNQ